MTATSFKPKVSVVICFFNEQQFLGEAIESVIWQGYDNWELILVDDGSTDQSTAIAREYVSNYAGKMVYVDHERHANRGLSFSRNRGIEMSRGNYVAFLDADDVWGREKLDRQIILLGQYPQAAMLCEASEYWYENWRDKRKSNVIKQIGHTQDKLFFPPDLLGEVYPLSDGYAPCPSGIIVKREVLNKHNGFEEHFTGSLQLYEDQAMLHKMYLNEVVYISSQCNHKYRQREVSLVRTITGSGNYHSVRKFFLEWLQNYVKRQGIRNREVLKLLQRALFRYKHPRIYFVYQWILRIQRSIKRRL